MKLYLSKNPPAEPEETESLACARCSGGIGLLCDRCVIEVAAAAIETLETGKP